MGAALHGHIEYIKGETLAVDLRKGQIVGAEAFPHTIDGEELTLTLAAMET